MTKRNNSENPNVAIPNSREKYSTESFKYPREDLSASVKLIFQEYQRPDPFSRPSEKVTGRVILPLPTQIIDNQGVSYAGTELGILGNVMGELDNPSTPNVKDIAGVMGFVRQGAAMMVPALKSMAFGSDSNVMKNASNVFGIIANPRMTAVFDGVPLRAFNFFWKISPRTEAESEEFVAMKEFIEERIHPKSSNFFYDYPDQVIVKFLGVKLFKINKSFITNFSIDYTGANIPSFYNSTHPVEMNISMTIQEIEPLTRERVSDRIDKLD